MKTIHLPAVNKKLTLGQYVQAIKLARDHPEWEFKHGLTCWWPCSGREIMRQFREGVEERINKKGQAS